MMESGQLVMKKASDWPSWQTNLRANAPFKMEGDNSTIIDEMGNDCKTVDGKELWPTAASSFKTPEEEPAESE